MKVRPETPATFQRSGRRRPSAADTFGARLAAAFEASVIDRAVATDPGRFSAEQLVTVRERVDHVREQLGAEAGRVGDLAELLARHVLAVAQRYGERLRKNPAGKPTGDAVVLAELLAERWPLDAIPAEALGAEDVLWLQFAAEVEEVAAELASTPSLRWPTNVNVEEIASALEALEDEDARAMAERLRQGRPVEAEPSPRDAWTHPQLAALVVWARKAREESLPARFPIASNTIARAAIVAVSNGSAWGPYRAKDAKPPPPPDPLPRTREARRAFAEELDRACDALYASPGGVLLSFTETEREASRARLSGLLRALGGEDLGALEARLERSRAQLSRAPSPGEVESYVRRYVRSLTLDLSVGRWPSSLPEPPPPPEPKVNPFGSQWEPPVITERSRAPRVILRLAWSGRITKPVQLALSFTGSVSAAIVHGVLDELHEEGLRDWFCLHRMAAEQGRTGRIRWTFDEHIRGTDWERLIARGKVTRGEVLDAITRRLWNLHGADLLCEREVQAPDGRTKVERVRVGEQGLIAIEATRTDGEKLELAFIDLNPAIYEGAHRDTPHDHKHYVQIPEAVLRLRGPSLRLAALIAIEARWALGEECLLNLSESYLHELARTHRTGKPSTHHRGAARKALEGCLTETLDAYGGGMSFRAVDRADGRHYVVGPAQWLVDTVIHRVTEPLKVAVHQKLPRTGAELFAWRIPRGFTQADIGRALGVHERTVRKAELLSDRTLPRSMLRKLAALVALDAPRLPPPSLRR